MTKKTPLTALLLASALALPLLADDATQPAPETHAPPCAPADEHYTLADGEFVKRFDQRYDSRLDIYNATDPDQAKAIPAGPDATVLRFRDGKLFHGGNRFGGPWDLGWLIYLTLQERPETLGGDRQLIDKTILPGDFIVRIDAPLDKRLADLQKILDDASLNISLTYKTIKKKAIILHGDWTGTIPNADKKELEIYGQELDPYPEADASASGNMADLSRALTLWLRRPVSVEPTGGPPEVGWHFNNASDAPGDAYKKSHDLKLVLQHFKEQTGLTETEEEREVPQLVVESKQP